MKNFKKVLSLVVCIAMLACVAITGMPMVSAEDTETTTTTYPLEFANLNAWEWPIVNPGLNDDWHATHLDRYLNFTPRNTTSPNPTETAYNSVLVNRAAMGWAAADLSGADVFTFVLTVEDNGAWNVYKDHIYVRLHSANGNADIPAADVAKALKNYVPGTTQKIKFDLSNVSAATLASVHAVEVGVPTGAATSELDLHINIITMLAEVLPERVLFAQLGWDWPMVNPGLSGTLSGSADADAATLNRWLNFTSDISTDVKSGVTVIRSAASKAGVDLSLCDYFALDFWVEDNGAWPVYKDYIQFVVNGQQISAADVAKAVAGVVPGTESRIYIPLDSINKGNLTSTDTFGISVGGTDQTSELNLHIKANDLYGEMAYDDIVLVDDEAGEGVTGLGVKSEVARVGTNSYNASSWLNGLLCQSGFWGGTSFPVPKDISKLTANGTAGYLRFWVYADSQADLDVYATYSTDISVGDSTDPDGVSGNGAWLVWGGWGNKVTKLGWNEIILPIASAGKTGTVDFTNIKSMKIRVNGIDGFNVQFDDFRVSQNGTPTAACEDVAVIDDEAKEALSSSGAAYVDNVAKVGNTSMRVAPYDGGNLIINGFWGRAHMTSKDISAITNNGKAGALRFWIYIPDTTSLTGVKSGSSYVQIGDSTSPDGNNGDGYWHTWSGWANQITGIGWNEIILPFKNGSNADYTNIKSIWLRTPNNTSGFTAYIDDLKVTESLSPTVESFNDVAILDEENGEDGAYAELSDVRVRVGSKSLEVNTMPNDGWVTFKGFYGEDVMTTKDISATTNNGKMGALRFWLYVEDVASFDVVKELFDNGATSYLKLGTAKSPDGAYFGWTGWANQVTKSGWNEIILPFASCWYEGGVAPDATALDTLYVKFPLGTPSIKLYIDDMKVSYDIAPSAVEGDINADGVLNVLDLIAVKKALANGEEGYTADTLALVRKYLVNKW